MLTCAAGMIVKRSAALSALVITAYLLTWVLMLQAPRVARVPGSVGMWLDFCESLFLMCGGWIVFTSLVEPGSRLDMKFIAREAGVRVARYLIGVSCLVFGLSHFVYAHFTAGMVPAWLPGRIDFVYLTGVGHLAAGLGILLTIVPRHAATAEAIMISSFALLVHIPGVASEPGSRMQWTMLFIALAVAGAASATATSLRGSWGWLRRLDTASNIRTLRIDSELHEPVGDMSPTNPTS
jgi:uncharacterized membrane protein YphA (DoxX/SURF4 family)